MEPIKCRWAGCLNTHKSSTGYCADHVEAGQRREMHVEPRSKHVEALLFEERNWGINWPKVI